MILADIFDLLQVINATMIKLSGNKPKKFTPYPRPGKDNDKKRIGKGAMPFNKLREWMEERRHG